MEDDNFSDNSENMDESDEDYNEPLPASSQGSSSKNLSLNDGSQPPKKKRKRKEGRKRIRKILPQEKLQTETRTAQQEEQERLRRLELQKSLNSAPAARITPPLDKSSANQEKSLPILDRSSPGLDARQTHEKPVLVSIPAKVVDPVIVIDDSDEDSDIVEMSPQVSDCVVISDSEAEESDEEANEADDQEPENSGSHTNDDVNQPDVHGRVLVNVNHPPSEPDIFLASHLCGIVKPHQVFVRSGTDL